MDHADGSTEAYFSLDKLDAGIGRLGCGLVVEGQHHAGDSLYNEEKSRDTAQAVPPAALPIGHGLCEHLG